MQSQIWLAPSSAERILRTVAALNVRHTAFMSSTGTYRALIDSSVLSGIQGHLGIRIASRIRRLVQALRFVASQVPPSPLGDRVGEGALELAAQLDAPPR